MLPYVKDLLNREVHAHDWFYVEILGATGLTAARRSLPLFKPSTPLLRTWRYRLA